MHGRNQAQGQVAPARTASRTRGVPDWSLRGVLRKPNVLKGTGTCKPESELAALKSATPAHLGPNDQSQHRTCMRGSRWMRAILGCSTHRLVAHMDIPCNHNVGIHVIMVILEASYRPARPTYLMGMVVRVAAADLARRVDGKRWLRR